MLVIWGREGWDLEMEDMELLRFDIEEREGLEGGVIVEVKVEPQEGDVVAADQFTVLC